MPRYQLAIEGLDGVHHREAPNVQAAKGETIRLVADVLCKEVQAFWDQEHHRVVVSDDTGLTLFIVDIATVVSPATVPPRAARLRP